MFKRVMFTALLMITAIPISFAADTEKDCTNLVLDYAYYRDRPEPEKFSKLFALNGSLSVGGETWVGRQAILDRLEDSRDGPVYRHLMSTIRIFPVDADHATGVSYVTVYNAPPDKRSVEGFAAIGEYHDNFIRTDEGWKIESREFVPVFFYGDEN